MNALEIVSHWFPDDIEPLVSVTGHFLLPLVQTVSEYIRPLFVAGKLCKVLQEIVAEMLQSTSRSSDYAWKKLSICLVTDIVSKQRDFELLTSPDGQLNARYACLSSH